MKPESQDEDGPSGMVPMAYVEEVRTILRVRVTHQHDDMPPRPNIPEW